MANMIKIPALALAVSGLACAMPASAAPAFNAAPQAHAAVYGDLSYDHGKKHKRWHREREREREWHRDRARYRYGERRAYYQPRRVYVQPRSYYASRPYYMGYASNYGQPVYRDTRIWRGNDGRYYCRRSNGTTGLLVGAGVGALLGNEIAGRGDRTLGAIVGGVAGALLGRSIDRSNTRCG